MISVTKILSVAVLLCSWTPVAQAANVVLDTMVMQLRSGSDSNSTQLLDIVHKQTTEYLNSYFSAYYRDTGSEGYFNEVLLTTNSFGIQGVTGSFINTIEFDGELAFNAESLPSDSFVKSLIENAFKGSNLVLYLEKILDSEDPFLIDLSYVIVEINDTPISEHDLDSMDEKVSNALKKGRWNIEYWGEIAIYCAAGVVFFILCLILYCACRSRGSKRQVQDNVEVVKNKPMEIPVEIETKQKSQRLKSTRYNNTRNMGFESQGRTRPRSPDRTLVSHDSSIFTHGQDVSRDIATLSLGSVSNMNIDLPHFDLEAWRGQNTISSAVPAPFGSDISAIEQKDQFGHMEEGTAYSYRKPRRHYKKKRTSGLEVRNSKSRSLKPIPADYPLEESYSGSSDVINDLKDLSLQIDRHRQP